MDISLYIISGIALIVIGVVIVTLVMYLIAKSKGRIEIQLEKTQFRQGETINGKLNLILKKPLQAKELRVGLVGIQRRRNYSSRGTSYYDEKVFEFFQKLDGEKVYSSTIQPYSFSIGIPSNLVSQLENPVGKTIVGVISALTGSFSSIRWFVVAELDIKGFDITKKVQINIY